MKKIFSFDDHVAEYEEWYDEYPWVFKSEVEALREMLPKGSNLSGIEVGVGTGKFSEALGIKMGVDPSPAMRELAIKRGIETIDGTAESLPYEDHEFDFVLMNFCISYFEDLLQPFKEANRVLKSEGALVVSFIEKYSAIGKYYEILKPESTFYKQATFYSLDSVLAALKQAGFKHTSICQTLFNSLNEINEIQPFKPGYGEGSFVVIKALKQKTGTEER